MSGCLTIPATLDWVCGSADVTALGALCAFGAGAGVMLLFVIALGYHR